MDSPGIAESVWRISEASVRGKSHIEGGLPNQDFVFVATDRTGQTVCAAVSDGAGTAPRAREGSEETARSVAQRLCTAGERWKDGPLRAEFVREEIELGIRELRDRILAEKGDLKEFHCTLVVWLFAPGGSFVAQIGDSVALTTRFAFVDETGTRQLDYFPEGLHTLHEVERGEYSNETHFVTEPDWIDHLRVATLPSGVDAVILMTDGAMDVAMLRGEVFRGFLSNLMTKLLATPDRLERNRVIHHWLDDPKTHRVTGDDKTLLVGIRNKPREWQTAKVFTGQRRKDDHVAKSAQPTVAPSPPRPQSPSVPARPATRDATNPSAATKSSRGNSLLRSSRSLASDHLVAIAAAGLCVVVAALLYSLMADDRTRPLDEKRMGPTRADMSPVPLIDSEGGAFATPTQSPPEGAQRAVARRSPGHGVTVSSTTSFEKGTALATVAVNGNAVVTIARIAIDPVLSLNSTRADSCRERLQLQAGQPCRLVVEVQPTTPVGEYGVDITFDKGADGAPFSQRVVFEVRSTAANQDKRR